MRGCRDCGLQGGLRRLGCILPWHAIISFHKKATKSAKSCVYATKRVASQAAPEVKYPFCSLYFSCFRLTCNSRAFHSHFSRPMLLHTTHTKPVSDGRRGEDLKSSINAVLKSQDPAMAPAAHVPDLRHGKPPSFADSMCSVVQVTQRCMLAFAGYPLHPGCHAYFPAQDCSLHAVMNEWCHDTVSFGVVYPGWQGHAPHNMLNPLW